MKAVRENVFNEMVLGKWWNLSLFIEEIFQDNTEQSLQYLGEMMKMRSKSVHEQSASGKLNQNTNQSKNPSKF